MGLISDGRGVFAAAARGVAAATRAFLQTLLQAAVFAAVVALLVWLLPGKLPVALFTLYGFICVWLLQLGAAGILLLTLVRAPFSTEARGDVVKAVAICGGFLIVVALCNAYILTLAQVWGRDFGQPVHHIPLTTFLDADSQMIGIAASVGAATIAFIDRIAVALLHLSQPPVQLFFAGIAAKIGYATSALTSAIPSKLAEVMGFGAVTGLVFSLWMRLAKGPRNR